MYKTVNKINGKYYIGVHSSKKIDDDYLGSGKIIRYAIRKYGVDMFEKIILEYFDSADSMFEAEKNIVNLDLINDELCMNLREGGIGGWTKEQQIENAKKSNLKQKFLRENDSDWVEKKSKKISENLKEEYKNGKRERKYFFDCNGRKHKKETIMKMEKSKNVGKNNSQYGTKWMTNEEISIKVKSENVEKYLIDGWRLGRAKKL